MRPNPEGWRFHGENKQRMESCLQVEYILLALLCRAQLSPPRVPCTIGQTGTVSGNEVVL
jgi:hypothetical protein